MSCDVFRDSHTTSAVSTFSNNFRPDVVPNVFLQMFRKTFTVSVVVAFPPIKTYTFPPFPPPPCVAAWDRQEGAIVKETSLLKTRFVNQAGEIKIISGILF